MVASGAASCLICYSAVKRTNPVSLPVGVGVSANRIICNTEKCTFLLLVCYVFHLNVNRSASVAFTSLNIV